MILRPNHACVCEVSEANVAQLTLSRSERSDRSAGGRKLREEGERIPARAKENTVSAGVLGTLAVVSAALDTCLRRQNRLKIDDLGPLEGKFSRGLRPLDPCSPALRAGKVKSACGADLQKYSSS